MANPVPSMVNPLQSIVNPVPSVVNLSPSVVNPSPSLPLTEENIEKLHEELGDSVSEVEVVESQEILDLTHAMIQI